MSGYSHMFNLDVLEFTIVMLCICCHHCKSGGESQHSCLQEYCMSIMYDPERKHAN